MGSKVEEDVLRFDFGYPGAVEADKQTAIQKEVLARVAAKAPISAKFVPLAEARSAGAMMLFGEKYPDPARMVSMGDFSRELCGGTHLDNTADVGDFDLISEEAVSAGVRRIVAYTGTKAQEYLKKSAAAVQEVAQKLAVSPADVPAAVKQLAQQVRDLKKQLASGSKPAAAGAPATATTRMGGVLNVAETKAALRDAARALNVGLFDVPQRVVALLAEVAEVTRQIEDKSQGGQLSADDLLKQAITVGSSMLIVAETPNANSNQMRQWIDQIRKQVTPAAIFLATAEGPDKVVLVAGITKDLIERGLSAGQWVKEIAPVVGGGGGGKPDLAQAGGKDAAKLADALAKAREIAHGWLK
jgi:alanyl-tRNA synthetase